jgi:low temperature requirement protein LtrA
MWWMYFTIPSAQVLRAHRERAFPWGYGHILIFGSIAATGAGLQVAAAYLTGETHIGATATVLAVVVPVAVYVFALFALYTYLVQASDPFHLTLLAGTAGVLALATFLASAGVGMSVCLIVVMFAPLVTVVGYETIGHRHIRAALERIGAN